MIGQSDRSALFPYRPALDGLRAVAILMILTYHTGAASWMPGGFFSVDLFLALSGFLITALLFAERDRSGGIDLRAFWARRARRLLPALAVMLAGTAIYVLTVASPEQSERFGRDAVAALAYVANWNFVLLGTDYFAQFGEPSLLLHTWSLAVEEQFYLVWPLVCWFGLIRLGLDRRGWAAVTAAALVGSAGLMAWLIGEGANVSRVFYGTDTRAQALLAGALAACLLAGRGGDIGRTWGRWLGWIGLGGLATLAAFAHETDLWVYRGGFLLAAIATTLAVVGGSTEGTAYTRVLALAPLVWIGRRSYGTYLWYWPVFSVLDAERTGLEGVPLDVVRFAVTFALGALSYRLVEVPMRFGHLGGRRRIAVVGGALATVLLIGAAWVIPSDQARDLRQLAAATTADGRPLRILLAGDSVPWRLEWIAEERSSPRWQVAAQIGCGVDGGTTLLPSGARGQRDDVCSRWAERWADTTQFFEPDVAILMVGTWEIYDREVDGRVLPAGTIAAGEQLLADLDLAHDILTSTGATLVVTNLPCFGELSDTPQNAEHREVRTDVDRIDWFNAVLDVFVQANPGTVMIDLASWTCPGGTEARLPNGGRLRSDGIHYSAAGELALLEWLQEQAAAVHASANNN